MDGNIVWEWNISDHVVQDFDPELPDYGVVSEHPGKLDINFGPGVSGNWIHMNSWDYNETLDHVVINNSRLSEFYVVDHGATFVAGDPQRSRELAASDAGDFLYRWGNPCVSDSGDCPSMSAEGTATSNGHQQVFFSHDIQWIDSRDFGALEQPVPGAGHFLIFNNGARQPGPTFSSVMEIDPYDGPMENGIHVPAAVAGYEPMRVGGGMSTRTQNVSRQVVWSFHGVSPNSFYSPYISGAQRLPNGNTLVCSGAHGHMFEVTPDGDIVWEYINPVGDRLVNDRGIYRTMTDKAGDEFNSMFKCQRYSPDYPGLEGRDLTPKGDDYGVLPGRRRDETVNGPATLFAGSGGIPDGRGVRPLLDGGLVALEGRFAQCDRIEERMPRRRYFDGSGVVERGCFRVEVRVLPDRRQLRCAYGVGVGLRFRGPPYCPPEVPGHRRRGRARPIAPRCGPVHGPCRRRPANP